MCLCPRACGAAPAGGIAKGRPGVGAESSLGMGICGGSDGEFGRSGAVPAESAQERAGVLDGGELPGVRDGRRAPVWGSATDLAG